MSSLKTKQQFNTRLYLSITLITTTLLLCLLKSNAQNTVYTPLYTSGNFVKTIDFSKPVGEIAGSVSTTPSGGVTYSIPIFTCPGTNGTQPSISLTYNSQAGSGIAGYGWNIAGLSAISRTGKNIYHNGMVTPVNFSPDDAFLLDGMRLNVISGIHGADAVYAGETESFSKILSFNSGFPGHPEWFKVIAKDGSVMEFGHSTDSRVLAINSAYVVMWRLNRVIDINGNYIDFVYDNAGLDSRISQILYTGNINTGLLPYNQINFSYSLRSDQNIVYENGAPLTAKNLLDKITLLHTNDANFNEIVKTYKLNYGFDNINSMLKEIVEFGGDENATSLNSTIFLYGDPGGDMSTGLTAQHTSREYLTGDFNGDGKTDVLASESYTVDDIKYSSGYKVFLDPQSNIPLYEKIFPPGHIVIESRKFVNYLTSDYNRDGRDDVIHVKTKFVTHPSGGTNWLADRFAIEFTTTTGSWTQDMPMPNARKIHPSGNFFIPGDFDGDGNQDYITILADHTVNTNSYFAYLCTPGTIFANDRILNFSQFGESTANGIASADKIVPFDHDGDGKQEILIVKAGVYSTILSIGPGINGFKYKATVLYHTPEIESGDKLFPGDFNGDKKTDFLQRKANGQWRILYSAGNAFYNTVFSFNQTVVMNGGSSDHKIVIGDFNGDGKSDIVHGFPVNSTSSKFSMYYSIGLNSYSTGQSGTFFYEQYNYNRELTSNFELNTGDFNGDGRSDLFIEPNYTINAEIAYFKPYNQERLLQKITTGHNVTTSFEYKALTDKRVSPFVYNRTVSLDDPINQNPFNYVELPMYVLATITYPDGAGGNNISNYNYENVVLHRAAKGLLGFKKVTIQNNVNNTRSVTENEINTQFAVPYTVRQTSHINSTNQQLSEILITNSFQNLSTGSHDIRYLQKIEKNLSIDYLNDNRASESVNTYDSYGNIINNTTKIGYYSGINNVSAVETIVSSSAFSIRNTPVPAKPDYVTTTKTRVGMPGISETTTYAYTTNGLIASETKFSGLPQAVTLSYTYNNFGNPISIATSTAGLNNRYAYSTYDAKGRFVLSTQKVGSGLSQTVSNTVSSKWGLPLTNTSTECLTNINEYDAFGKLFHSVLPGGNEVTINDYWHVFNVYTLPNPDKLYYTQTNYLGGKPDTKNYKDKFGHSWLQQTQSMYGIDGAWHTMRTTYDNRGNVKTKTNLYFPATLIAASSFTQPVETPRITTFNYDVYNRVSSIVNDIGTINYAYNQAGNGKMQTTIINIAGQSSSEITDATGKIVSSIDNGGQLDFVYDSRDNKTEAKRSTTTLVSSAYDVYGRQTNTIDINAGTTLYTYDAYGLLKQQTDALGNTYNMSYDDLGRITSRVGPEGVTAYEYYNDASTNCSNNNISKITGFNGVIKEYTFDALKRPATETQLIDGSTYTTTFEYDNFSQLIKTTHPSGVAVYQTYDENGYLTKVYHSSGHPKNSIFANGWVDGEGKYLTYGLGFGKTTDNTYNKGFPVTTITSGVQSLAYNFDLQTGNLLQRTDVLKNQTEYFGFDNLNRLTASTPNNNQQSGITYDANGSVSMGNIVAKTDAGYYKYRNDKVNAIAYIMNTPVPGQQPVTPVPNTQISLLEQLISYTPFLKAATVGEGSYTGGPYIEYMYGPDHQRVKSELWQGHLGLTETKYYLGDYEKQIKNGVTREIHYVGGGNGLCAILVKESGVLSSYIVYKDHLGSITTITDNNGSNIIAEQNFDAWGRNRNPNNWNLYEPYPNLPDWLYRGYTGHEMMPLFSLINMNGRMYDPTTGRMLSSDNLLPAPNSTQGYNRYSYAYNNPLLYTDPDGNYGVVAAIIVGAVVGAYLGGTIANGGNYNPLQWNWKAGKTWTYLVGGAIVGGVSGYLGGAVAASGMPFANTAGIMVSSFTSSIGMTMITNGEVPVSIGFGVASFTFESGEFNYLGKKGNSFLENVGYALGALANLQDAVAGVNGITATYRAEKGDVAHARLEGDYTTNTDPASTEMVDISVSHSDDPMYDATYKYNGESGLLNNLDYAQYWSTHVVPGIHSASRSSKALPIPLNNVNGKWLSNMTKRIVAGHGKFGIGKLKYGTTAFGCQSHVAQALWGVGVPTLPINLFPMMLYSQLAIRQIGIYASPYLINR